MDFVETVLAQVLHATPKEKKRLRDELEGHLEDHAGALAEAGYDPGEARTRAEEAMGDPEEIGRELDRQYPQLWLFLSRTLPAAFLLAVLCFAGSSPVTAVVENLRARQDPASAVDESNGLEAQGYSRVREVDIRVELPGDDVMRIYEVGVNEAGDEAGLLVMAYDKNPFGHASLDGLYRLTIDGAGPGTIGGGAYEGWSTTDRRFVGIPVAPGQTALTVRSDTDGQNFRVEVPLPEKEGQP